MNGKPETGSDRIFAETTTSMATAKNRDRIDQVFRLAEQYFATLPECPGQPLRLLVRLLSLTVIADPRGCDYPQHLSLLAASVSVGRGDYVRILAALIDANPEGLGFKSSPSLSLVENKVQAHVLLSLDAIRPFFANGCFLESQYRKYVALRAVSADIREACNVAFRLLDEPYNTLARNLLGNDR